MIFSQWFIMLTGVKISNLPLLMAERPMAVAARLSLIKTEATRTTEVSFSESIFLCLLFYGWRVFFVFKYFADFIVLLLGDFSRSLAWIVFFLDV